MGVGDSPASRSEDLGTFLGVYTPSVLTILGVILFLRTGWVVGRVGLVPALAIVVLAHVITVSTALSVSAVATNMKVGTGGAYYMISRSLGLEIGGAIGIPLFLAQTFSVTLYCFGLAESLQLIWPQVPVRWVAAIAILAVSLLAGQGTKLALKLQVPIMAAIGVALVSLLAGSVLKASPSPGLWQVDPPAGSFWPTFAVFFPAVTGIMAGISLSGDLKDPKRSLPVGTLLAVGSGFLVYLAVPIALAMSSDAYTLATDNLIWFKISVIPLLVFPALWGAIFSSAVGSILGAPRTFEALIADRVVPGVPAKIFGRSVPHLAATGIALAAVGLGDLDAVAPVLTMFFLTTYGMVNLVAGVEQLSGAPSFRPSIRVPSIVSLLGAGACLWVMWLISRQAAVAAVVLELGIYLLLRRRALNASWGDARFGALISIARTVLLKLKRLPVDPRNWRPHILVFAGDVAKRLDLVRFAAWLNQDRGILTVCKLEVGSLEEMVPGVAAEREQMDNLLDREGILAFAEVDVVSEFESGVLEVAQANGIAGIDSNTLMLGWSAKPERRRATLRIVRKAALLGKSTLLCKIEPQRWPGKYKRIDVWWGGLKNNGDMLLLFAHLISQNPEWSSAQITVKSITSNVMTFEQSKRHLTDLLKRSRIAARTRTLQLPPDATVLEVIHRESRGADVVFMGLQETKAGEEEAYAQRLAELVGDLPSVILLRAAGPFAGDLLQGE